MPKLEKNCQVCGQTFVSKPSDNRTFCSLKCHYANLRVQRAERSCSVCSKSFVLVSSNPKQMYCSPECRCIASRKQRTERICEVCQKSFTPRYNSSDSKCCSPDCGKVLRINKGRETKQLRHADRNCKQCRNRFSGSPSVMRYKDGTSRLFCSQKCFHVYVEHQRKALLSKRGASTKEMVKRIRYDRIKTNGGRYSNAEWLNLCAHYGYRCLCCGEQKPLTADHIVPVADGGRSDITNIQPLCRVCNSKKGTRILDFRPLN